MDYNKELLPTTILHWNYRGFTEFPIQRLYGDETEITDIYLKENLISRIPCEIGKLVHLESLYLSGNDITELPSEISQLRCLKCLDVSGNRLRYIPEEIGEVKSLKFLILDENELSELPLRIAELRSLRYLSVCDNKLTWLPQRPVYNYHHCELRFWRNITLKTIPYSLWYHMFRDQQTRSLNIGCLSIPKHQHATQSSRIRLKLSQESKDLELDVDFPPQYTNISESCISPPSLFEQCRRKFYQMLTDTANNLSTEFTSIYSDSPYEYGRNKNDSSINLEDTLAEFDIDNGNPVDYDLNGNDLTSCARNETSNLLNHIHIIDSKRKIGKARYVPADVIEDYFSFLPSFIKRNLCSGPISRCENVNCKKPVFDYVIYEFCIGKIILIDKTEDVVLSATFCSKPCADLWKRRKTNILPWKLLKEQ